MDEGMGSDEVIIYVEQHNLHPLTFTTFNKSKFISLLVHFLLLLVLMLTLSLTYLVFSKPLLMMLIITFFIVLIAFSAVSVFLKHYKPPYRLEFLIKNHSVISIKYGKEELYFSHSPQQLRHQTPLINSRSCVFVRVVKRNSLFCILNFASVELSPCSKFMMVLTAQMINFFSRPVQLQPQECDKFFKLLEKVKNVEVLDNNTYVFVKP